MLTEFALLIDKFVLTEFVLTDWLAFVPVLAPGGWQPLLSANIPKAVADKTSVSARKKFLILLSLLKIIKFVRDILHYLSFFQIGEFFNQLLLTEAGKADG